MGKYPKTVIGYPGTLAELAKATCNMEYDALAEYIGHLADELQMQAQSDRRKGRKKLSAELEAAAADLQRTKLDLLKAIEISKPYMDKD